ncbi:MAG: alanine racemase [Prolixibacteraceae bacterium]|nr:alanine racemase [Prolixibacteraceae bacterium]
MAEKAKRHNLRIRPHFKTHQSAEVGRWFREKGIKQITVSSIQMAKYFANDGWNDITIAFPFNLPEIDELNAFPSTIKINILADNIHTVETVGKALKRKTGIYLKIVNDYYRSGIAYSSVKKIDNLIALIGQYKKFDFKGFLTHSGQTYQSSSKHEIRTIHFDTVQKLKKLKYKYIETFPNIELSVGDTPSCSVSEYFDGITEMRPGNFVFYDLMQHSLGACSIDDIALSMYCPVVSKQRSRNEIIIYGGAAHFSKDFIMNTDGKQLYGRVILKNDNERKLLPTKSYLKGLTQEHGIIRVSPREFKQIKIGSVLEIIPVHACLTALAMGRYITTKGDVIEMMPRF